MKKKVASQQKVAVKSAASKKAGAEPSKPRSSTPAKAGLVKKYLKARDVCKVTFVLPKEAAPDAKSVALAGDFNDWDPSGAEMKKLKNGNYTMTLDLPTGREYRFRYLIDGERWENDWNADRYEQNPFGGEDSIVVV